MPQMSFMLWLILFFYFLLCFSIIFNEIYFFMVFIKLSYFEIKKFVKNYFSLKW